jgi:hypothetical protein
MSDQSNDRKAFLIVIDEAVEVTKLDLGQGCFLVSVYYELKLVITATVIHVVAGYISVYTERSLVLPCEVYGDVEHIPA